MSDAPATVNAKSFTSTVIPRAQILVDDRFNVRKVYDPSSKDGVVGQTIEELAADINARRLLQPVMVRPNPDSKTKDSKPYALTIGFRRLKAMDLLGWTTIPAEIFEGDETAALAANAAENIARENLRPWEISQRLVELKKRVSEGGKPLSGAKVGLMLGLSKPYTNSLMRIEENAIPEVLEAFHSDRSPAINDLLKMVAFPEPEQRQKWREYLGLEDETPAESEGEGEAAPERKSRPSLAALTAALAYVRGLIKESELEPAVGKAYVNALRYAAGQTAGITGVYDAAKLKAAAKKAQKAKKTEE